MALAKAYSFDDPYSMNQGSTDAIPSMFSTGDPGQPSSPSQPTPSFSTGDQQTGSNFGDTKGPEVGAASPGSNVSTALAGQATSGGGATSGGTDLTSMLNTLKSTTDPQQAAILQDQLARTLYSDLQAAGHDVKWNGDQLMVDGRAYAIGGANTASSPDWTSAIGAMNSAAVAASGAAPVTASGAPGQTIYHPEAAQGGVFGFDTGKLNDPNYLDAKYTPAAKTFSAGMAAGVQISRGNLDAMVQFAQAHGMNARAVGDDKIDFGDGEGPVDVLANQGGHDLIVFQNNQGGGGGGTTSYDLSGVDLGPAPINATGQPNTNYGAPPAPSWMPGAGPTYTPGDIPTSDLPNFSYDGLYNQVVGGGSAADQNTDTLVNSLLTNPDSIDAHTLDTMKAKSKDELAQQQQQEEQDLRSFGNAAGIDDSNWLASARASSRQNRDMALVKSNRDLELQAATTNKSDERAAAQLGASYTAQKAQIRQNAAQLASDATLRQASLNTDRMALRESVKQKAAELGISSDQVMSQYLLGLADNATRLHGIDVSASIDWAKLKEQSVEFKEDIAFRLSQLNQQADQFGYSYGLDAARLSHTIDQDMYNRSQGGTATAPS